MQGIALGQSASPSMLVADGLHNEGLGGRGPDSQQGSLPNAIAHDPQAFCHRSNPEPDVNDRRRTLVWRVGMGMNNDVRAVLSANEIHLVMEATRPWRAQIHWAQAYVLLLLGWYDYPIGFNRKRGPHRDDPDLRPVGVAGERPVRFEFRLVVDCPH
jgi:hypothetical protein